MNGAEEASRSEEGTSGRSGGNVKRPSGKSRNPRPPTYEDGAPKIVLRLIARATRPAKSTRLKEPTPSSNQPPPAGGSAAEGKAHSTATANARLSGSPGPSLKLACFAPECP